MILFIPSLNVSAFLFSTKSFSCEYIYYKTRKIKSPILDESIAITLNGRLEFRLLVPFAKLLGVTMPPLCPGVMKRKRSCV